ncbi:MAG TPA: SDR family NAD(P)-dependent oxidoreductase [Melioribacteraceae bacterium]|nr:SDR family NAD(P)-dependent oxidoreductase [Melioribacteraceae bacterium]
MFLKGKGAIVTGGAMGIGFETARLLAKEGASVTIWDINHDQLQKSKAEIETYGGKVFAYTCDVTDKSKVEELKNRALLDMGSIDILINNAGYVKGGSLIDRSVDEWEKTIAVNFTSLVYTIRSVFKEMLERNSGYIINISSASSILGVADLSVYSATKWAVHGLTESLRFEAWNSNKKGVHIASVHPYYIKTGMFSGAKLNILGSMLVPLVKSHSVIARAIVYGAIKKRKTIVRRPVTLRLVGIFRGVLPDIVFQKFMVLFGVSTSMKTWQGSKD